MNEKQSPDNSWTIGRAPQCDLVVDSDQVSSFHCRLAETREGYVVSDLQSTNGTFVNGRRITESVPVKPGDKILLAGDVPMPWPKEVMPPTMPVRRLERPVTVRAEVAAREITIGRDPDSDYCVELPGVSWNHAKLVIEGERATLEDVGSANGTFIGSLKNRIERADLSRDEVVFLGTHRIEAADLFAAEVRDAPVEPLTIDVERPVVLGRDPSCDRVLKHPMVSWRHARITREGEGYRVEDLGSTNGTFINGDRVSGASSAQAGDLVSLGSYSITLNEMGHLVTVDGRGRLSIEARQLTVEVPDRRLLEDVSLTIRPGKFVGLMGLAGAGKSTLMSALNGYVPPTAGSVYIGGRNLYQHYDSFRGQIGYVPQDDIMHGDLTVREALYYTARLRLPVDFAADEIGERISDVLEQLGMKDAENVLIGSPEKKGISGGQRKRVNLAMELLTDPSILFLDEPTSGLSSEDALIVMNLLRELARSGKTILLTIHQPSLDAYRQMDDLIIIAKDPGSKDPGRLGWYGPAYPDAIEFFNPNGIPGLKPGAEPSPDEVLRGLGREPALVWTERYRRSRYHEQFLGGNPDRAVQAEPPPAKPMRREVGLRQAWTLLRRGLTLRLRDRANTALLMAQAPIIAILIVMVFGGDARQDVDINSWSSVVRGTAMACFLLGLSSLWCGCSNSVREIVGEWAIYRRERMVNLKIPSYIASKVGALLGLSAIQCLLMLALVYGGCGFQGPFWMMYLILLVAAVVGVGIGLAISALARSSEFAVAMLPIVILPMIMMGGAIQPLEKMNTLVRLGSHGVPSRWAFEAMLVLESEQRRPPEPPTASRDESPSRRLPVAAAHAQMSVMAEGFFPEEERRGKAWPAIVLGSMFALLMIVVGAVLKRRDIH